MRIICPVYASGRSSEKPYKDYWIDLDLLCRVCFCWRNLRYQNRSFLLSGTKILSYGGQHMKTEKPLMDKEITFLQQKLREKTGVQLKPYLVEQAFTRSSYARSYGGGSNEILEYIGDTIIGYYVVKKLFEHYGTIHKDEDWWY